MRSHPGPPGGRRGDALCGEGRGLVPAVGKALEIALVVLVVGSLATALYGSAVPGYRTAAATELGERTLVASAGDIEAAVPPAAADARVERRVDLPATIRNEVYALRAENGSLVLDHPDDRLDARTELVVPESVESVSGTWRSDQPAWVVVTGGGNSYTVRLEVRP